jgi:hypothetical protein
MFAQVHRVICALQADIMARQAPSGDGMGRGSDWLLVDVLQRVGQHPAAEVAQLTPRLWKQYFGDNPLRSDLFAISN